MGAVQINYLLYKRELILVFNFKKKGGVMIKMKGINLALNFSSSFPAYFFEEYKSKKPFPRNFL